MKHRTIAPLFVAGIFIACATSPQDIRFGEDACHFCLMTIVDESHAAELVTSKGKVYKFDAIECMAQYLKKTEKTNYAFQLVSDYDKPGTLINAESATYLVSPAIPSPMGAFLSAFTSEDRAMELRKENDGQLYDWKTLQDSLR
jgi:copper chaperone NosL